MYNQTYDGQRYSSLQQITTKNVASLRVLCKQPLDEMGEFEDGMSVIGDTMYVVTAHYTYALNAATCDKRWTSHYVSPVEEVSGRAARGVAVVDGLVIRGTNDAHLIAVDQNTGKLVWDNAVGSFSHGEFLSAAPVAWNHRVFVGMAGADWGANGRIMAFDAKTGKKVWEFHTIPTGNETGADTWKNAASAAVGGGSTWSTISLDPATGELFVPIGNPAPDFDGPYRPGANLFTDSVVVLNANDGKLVWWYQLIPHDTHDYDQASAPVLLTLPDGRALVAAANKDGYLYIVDRSSHKLVWKVPTTTIKNQQVPLIPNKGVHVCPGPLGGTQWNGPAYDQLHHVLIVGSIDWCAIETAKPAKHYKASPAYIFAGTFDWDPIAKETGWITAVDPASGRVVWHRHLSAPIVAGITPTAGGITFTADLAGHFLALDSASGRVLKTIATNGAIAGGVVTYAINGKQYVAFTSGNISRVGVARGLKTPGRPTIVITGL
jgi:alcohol dehydrogenase (cytochrome c)